MLKEPERIRSRRAFVQKTIGLLLGRMRLFLYLAKQPGRMGSGEI
jgi:hypothetical protein